MSALEWSLCDVATALRQGQLGAVELLSAAVEACEKLNPAVNALIGLSIERAMQEARQADQTPAHARGRLHGVPLGHKDMFQRRGETTSCGARHYPGAGTSETSVLLERLDRAGAISFARLNMAAFAMGPTGHNDDFGRCNNPYDLARITGGSSSGSAAAVAARMVFGALGSDTGGSIRLPAALCGVAGLKTTHGLLPMDGVMGLSDSLDSVGPIARCCADLALLMDVLSDDMSGKHSRALCHDMRTVTIGLPRTYYYEDLDPAVAARMEQVAGVFAGLGARLKSVDVPDHTHWADLADAIWKPEAAALHLNHLRTNSQLLPPQARTRLMQGLALSAVDYVRAKQLRSNALRDTLQGPLSECDLLLVPVMQGLTPLADDVSATQGETMRQNLARLTALTRPLNFLGLPGLSVPCGLDPAKMPMGFQLIGRPAAEPLLLACGAQFEKVGAFPTLRPPLDVVSQHIAPLAAEESSGKSVPSS